MNEVSELIHKSVYYKDNTDYIMLGRNKKTDFMIMYTSVVDPYVKIIIYDKYKESELLLNFVFAEMDNGLLYILEDYDIDIVRAVQQMNEKLDEYNENFDIKHKNNLQNSVEKTAFKTSKKIHSIIKNNYEDIFRHLEEFIDRGVSRYLKLGKTLSKQQEDLIKSIKNGLKE